MAIMTGVKSAQILGNRRAAYEQVSARPVASANRRAARDAASGHLIDFM